MIGRGEVWWASLGAPAGPEPGYRRPVLVIQSDSFNRSQIGTVLAVALTSNTRLARAPGNVLLGRRESGLPKGSVANVSQVVTLDRRVLTERVKRLSPTALGKIEAGLRLVMDL